MFVTLVKQYLYLDSSYKRRVASVRNEANGYYILPQH